MGLGEGVSFENQPRTIDQKISNLSRFVGELLAEKWTDQQIKTIEVERKQYIEEMEEQGIARTESSGRFNGGIGEAVGRKLWERVTHGQTENVLSMDKKYKTDALGRLKVNGKEVAVLMQFKATTDLAVGEMIVCYPRDGKVIPLRDSEAETKSNESLEQFDSRGKRLMEEIDPYQIIRKSLVKTSAMADYKQIGLDETIPLIMVVGVGRGGAWQELLRKVESGKLDELFKSSLIYGLDRTRAN